MKIDSQNKAVWQQVPAIAQLTADANHVDVKEFEGEGDLRIFLAQTLSAVPPSVLNQMGNAGVAA